MKNFALIGAAGYIAPRHMKAIKETGNRLVAACDKNDSVGIIDSYFPEADFFTEFERFDRHIEKLRRMKSERAIQYVSIASPNYLHDAHIRFGLRVGADVVCEKPLVINPWNIDALMDIEKETGKRIYSILQLRLHPTIIALKKRIDEDQSSRKHIIELTYITTRGKWYMYSWKGDEDKSGGLATNIGVHFFDMLAWIFGAPIKNVVNFKSNTRTSGYLELENACVQWLLSIEDKDLPNKIRESGGRTYRNIMIDSEHIEFSDGFADLHTRSYEEILSGKGFGIEETRQAINIVYGIRTAL